MADSTPTDAATRNYKELWARGDTPWHTRGVLNPLLLKHMNLFPDRKPLKVFVPLCGKDDGMIWLAEQGHEVVGLEYSDIACKDFFTDNGLEYTKQPIESDKIAGDVYKAKTLALIIYCCDFFKFIPEVAGTVDAVWDRGALNAMRGADVDRYVTVLKTLMKDDCVNLTDIVLGLPFLDTHTRDSIQKAYGESYRVEHIDSILPYTEGYKKEGVTTCELFCIKLA